MRLPSLTRLCVAILIVAASAPTYGQLAPSVGYLFPPVVAAGKTTTVQLGGYDFTSDMQYFIADEQLTLKANGEALSDYFVPTRLPKSPNAKLISK